MNVQLNLFSSLNMPHNKDVLLFGTKCLNASCVHDHSFITWPHKFCRTFLQHRHVPNFHL